MSTITNNYTLSPVRFSYIKDTNNNKGEEDTPHKKKRQGFSNKFRFFNNNCKAVYRKKSKKSKIKENKE